MPRVGASIDPPATIFALLRNSHCELRTGSSQQRESTSDAA
jgi:hypothetical protein